MTAIIAVFREVEQSLIHAQGLYNRYVEVARDGSATNQEQEWLSAELRSALRSVSWDLEDLEETCVLIARKQELIALKSAEVDDRRQFIAASWKLIQVAPRALGGRVDAAVQDIRGGMSGMDARFRDRPETTFAGPSASGGGSGGGGYKYSRLLDSEAQSPAPAGGRQFAADALQQQQLIMREQDDELERVGGSVRVLRDMSGRIAGELDEQAVMLDELGHDMDRTDTKLDSVMKKLAKVTHMSNDRRQWLVILVLIVILVIVISLFFI